MIYVFEVVSPALPDGTPPSDLDGEEWSFECVTRADADLRAAKRLHNTLSMASRERQAVTTIRFLAEYPSRRAYLAIGWAA